jgi:hypothetical protein
LEEKSKVYDLLDSLSCSGSLPFEHAEMHILFGLAHCFDQTIMDCLIKKNINPIEKVESTLLTAASVFFNCPQEDLAEK